MKACLVLCALVMGVDASGQECEVMVQWRLQVHRVFLPSLTSHPSYISRGYPQNSACGILKNFSSSLPSLLETKTLSMCR